MINRLVIEKGGGKAKEIERGVKNKLLTTWH